MVISDYFKEEIKKIYDVDLNKLLYIRIKLDLKYVQNIK